MEKRNKKNKEMDCKANEMREQIFSINQMKWITHTTYPFSFTISPFIETASVWGWKPHLTPNPLVQSTFVVYRQLLVPSVCAFINQDTTYTLLPFRIKN